MPGRAPSERISSDSFAIGGKRRFGSRYGPPAAAWMPIEACQPESMTAKGRLSPAGDSATTSPVIARTRSASMRS